MATPKRTIKREYLGTHIIVELFGCQRLNDAALIRRILKETARLCGVTVLHTKFHKFSPQGLTGYVLLAESHISIHTWPEYGYAAVDVFTCGLMDTGKAITYLAEQLGASQVETKEMLRGNCTAGIVNAKKSFVVC